jgi:hypothetical protein
MHTAANPSVKPQRRQATTPVASATKHSLSRDGQRLVELMQEINFGRIEGLAVANGEPVFDPPPRVVREIKLGGENGPRPERAAPDFALKGQLAELFQHLGRLGDGTVDVLQVKNGLPFLLVVSGLAP